MTTQRTARPRGTPDQAIADIAAAIDRLAQHRPRHTDGKLSAITLAAEAGMSRKQLYTYFTAAPRLRVLWDQLVEAARAPRDDADAVARRALEKQLDAWKAVAAIARAEAERVTEQNDALRRENERLRRTGPLDREVTALTPPTIVA